MILTSFCLAHTNRLPESLNSILTTSLLNSMEMFPKSSYTYVSDKKPHTQHTHTHTHTPHRHTHTHNTHTHTHTHYIHTHPSNSQGSNPETFCPSSQECYNPFSLSETTIAPTYGSASNPFKASPISFISPSHNALRAFRL